MDAVQASQSGHLGLPLGCAEMGAVLYGYALKYNPDKPRWIGRDYFVLSAGHGSMFLYAWLHMSGYDLPMSEIKRFRQLHSKTPGHPEFGDTPGVECTTGPLGQGVGNAVAIAKESDNGRPKFIVAHTLIGKGIPEVEGTFKAHGEAGAKFVDAARKGLGLPDEHYYVSKDTYDYFAAHKKKLLAEYDRWEKIYNDWRKKNAEEAKQLEAAIDRKVDVDLLSKIPEFPKDAKLATRKAGSEALQPVAQAMPLLISGSADLHGSTLNYIKDGGDFTRETQKGRNIHFGIREHGMCAILNGISYHGIFRASGATFLVFTDYCRASIRLAALSKLPNIYIFTHDSIGVGEDGPTHEPVETVSSVRIMPQID